MEHDDDYVGTCCPTPTPINPNSKPMDEATAMAKVKEILDASEKKRMSEGQGSDKENDQGEENNKKPDLKTYSRKPQTSNTMTKQKVLSAKNGTLSVTNTLTDQQQQQATSTGNQPPVVNDDDDCMIIDPNEEANPVKTDVKMDDVSEVKTEVKTEAKPEIQPEVKSEAVKEEIMPKPIIWGACLADNDNCTVHSTILPKTHWSYFASVEELDNLINSLNTRGFRESELRDKLANEREKLTKNLKTFAIEIEPKLNQELSDEKPKEKMVNGDVNKDLHAEANDVTTIVDLALRDQILELEEKIFFGTLGTLKIRKREAWQAAIQDGGYDQQCDSLAWGGKSIVNTPFESNLVSEAVSRDTSRPASPDRDLESNRDSGASFARRQNRKVKGLASAILQVAQMLDEKYLKAPLGELQYFWIMLLWSRSFSRFLQARTKRRRRSG